MKGRGLQLEATHRREASVDLGTPLSPLTPDVPQQANVGCEEVVELKAVLIAEFDNVHGPVIAHQWPKDFVPRGECGMYRAETVQDLGLHGTYLIPHEGLSGHVSTWSHGLHTFLSCPTTFKNAKYFRNVYRMNLIFVFSRGVDPGPYHSVIRRVSQAFQMLERDFMWMCRQSRTAMMGRANTGETPSKGNIDDNLATYEDDTEKEPLGVGDMPLITDMLKQLVEGFHEHNEVVIPFDDNGVILTFRVFAEIPDPGTVNLWDVPILLKKPTQEELLEWDLSLQLILPILTNKAYEYCTIQAMSTSLQMSPSACCFAVQHLIFYGYSRTVDVFQYSNFYTLDTSKFSEFCSRPLEKSVLSYVSADSDLPVAFVSLVNFYQGFGVRSPGVRTSGGAGYKKVEDVLRGLGEKPHQQCGDRSERRFEKWRGEWRTDLAERLSARHAVIYGTLYGFLKRIHEVPAFDSQKAARHPADRRRLQESPKYRPLYDILAGAEGRCIDDICATLGSGGEGWCREDVMQFASCCNIILK